MKIEIKTPGVHHIALRSSDLLRSKRFYTETLGFPVVLENDRHFMTNLLFGFSDARLNHSASLIRAMGLDANFGGTMPHPGVHRLLSEKLLIQRSL
jgi:catechol 2,3-dioxygenase-like lactoylglutathione lyase family enzyme